MSNETQSISDNNTVNNDSTKADSKNVYNNVPDDRFDKVISERNDERKKNETLQAQINDLSEQAKSKDEAELEKKGEYKELLAKRDAELAIAQEKADRLDLYENTRREHLMQKITNDDDRSIADGMSLDKLEKFVDRISVSTKGGSAVSARPKTLTESVGVSDEKDIWDMDSKKRSGNWSQIVNSFKK